jgi:hypothetical protein
MVGKWAWQGMEGDAGQGGKKGGEDVPSNEGEGGHGHKEDLGEVVVVDAA